MAALVEDVAIEEGLSLRQTDLLMALAFGETGPQYAARVGIEESTVRTHAERAAGKSGRSVRALVREIQRRRRVAT